MVTLCHYRAQRLGKRRLFSEFSAVTPFGGKPDAVADVSLFRPITIMPVPKGISMISWCTGPGGGIGERERPSLTALPVEITLIISSTFTVTDDAFSSRTRGTAHGSGSHKSTSIIPSYTE